MEQKHQTGVIHLSVLKAHWSEQYWGGIQCVKETPFSMTDVGKSYLVCQKCYRQRFSQAPYKILSISLPGCYATDLLVICLTFLSALQQNRAQSRFLYLFYDKESDNFPTHSAEFSNQTLFSKRAKVASAVHCSLIKHAKISQSQSLLELFK